MIAIIDRELNNLTPLRKILFEGAAFLLVLSPICVVLSNESLWHLPIHTRLTYWTFLANAAQLTQFGGLVLSLFGKGWPRILLLTIGLAEFFGYWHIGLGTIG